MPECSRANLFAPTPTYHEARVDSRHYLYLAILDGMIICALLRHVLGALVSAPPLVMLAVAALMAFGLARMECRTSGLDRTKLLPWVIVGVACGFTLPASLPPPRASVITHAPARFTHTDLFDALEQLDENPREVIGRRITVSGSWHSKRNGVPAAVSRRVMACCAADSIDVGFDVVPAGGVAASDGAQVRVSGVVQAWLRDGETRYTLRNATVSPCNSRICSTVRCVTFYRSSKLDRYIAAHAQINLCDYISARSSGET